MEIPVVTSFLFLFGLVNFLTPVLLISTPDQSDLLKFDNKQLLLMRNMFKGGVSLMFVALILSCI